MTAEELRQRLDGAKERVSSQPHAEQPSQTADSGEQQSSSSGGEERGVAGRGGAGRKGGRTLSELPISGLYTIEYLLLCKMYVDTLKNFRF